MTARLLLAGLLAAGCGAPTREAEPLDIAEIEVPREPEGPPRVLRVVLEDVMSRGPAHFLERMPVQPEVKDRKFVGYRVLAMYGRTRVHPQGVRVGDVVTAVNGLPIARPEQFMRVWAGLKDAKSIEVDVLREGQPVHVSYAIVSDDEALGPGPAAP